MDYLSLIPWVKTQRQKQVLRAVAEHGGEVAAAEALGVTRSYISSVTSMARCRARRQGHDPDHDMTHPVPEGYHVKGVSTLYGDNGQVRAQWVKSERDRSNKTEDLVAALSTLPDDFRGASSPVPEPADADDALMCVYPLGDPHLGMYAWAAEAGADFDLEIAESNLVAAVDKLVSWAPAAETAIVINLGDFFHSDNRKGTTTAGTPVDVDGRWVKVLSVGIRTMRRIIDRALEKHRTVHVKCAIGNHDDHTSIMLALALSMYYERDERVLVDTSPEPFLWHVFGDNLIGVHHGDRVKAKDLPAVMACDRAEDWGRTKHRYWYTGHVHHDTLKEYPGCYVETFRTLAPRDAWHHGQGYRSGQDLKCDVLHQRHGRINRHIVGIDQIWGD